MNKTVITVILVTLSILAALFIYSKNNKNTMATNNPLTYSSESYKIEGQSVSRSQFEELKSKLSIDPNFTEDIHLSEPGEPAKIHKATTIQGGILYEYSVTSIGTSIEYNIHKVSMSDTMYEEVLRSVSDDISNLKTSYPQLVEYSTDKNFDKERMAIEYSYHTHSRRLHDSEHTVGWTAGVPNPNSDGIWFYIDFHDPNSSAQIHTQPHVTMFCYGEKRSSFLHLEGENVTPVAGEITKILGNHGVKPCSS